MESHSFQPIYDRFLLPLPAIFCRQRPVPRSARRNLPRSICGIVFASFRPSVFRVLRLNVEILVVETTKNRRRENFEGLRFKNSFSSSFGSFLSMSKRRKKKKERNFFFQEKFLKIRFDTDWIVTSFYSFDTFL